MSHYRIPLFLLFVFFSQELSAQGIDRVLEFLTVHPNKRAVERDSSLYPAKIIFTPVVTYTPETSLGIGVGVKTLFKMRGSGSETRTSNMPLTVQYTIQNKYLFFSGFEVFTPQEKYMLTGNIRVQSFPSLYFDVGPDTPKSNEERFDYSQVLIEPILLRNLFTKYLFFGGGIRFNHVTRVDVEPGGILDASDRSGAKGFTSSGLQLAIIYDSRDNILNATEGMFASLTHGFYGSYLGGTQNFQLTRLDVRYFWQPLKKPSSILGLHFISQFSYGDVPLLELGRLGGHQIMRGHFSGRYTDRHLIATQVEWRQRLSPRWGAVAFAGMGSVAPSIDQFAFKTIRPSVGLGVRFVIDKKENLNLRLDFGAGNEKINYYFKVAESF